MKIEETVMDIQEQNSEHPKPRQTRVRKVHVMNYKCCEDCALRPESLYKKCKFGWHVFGSSLERSTCIFKRRNPEDAQMLLEEVKKYPSEQEILKQQRAWTITITRGMWDDLNQKIDSMENTIEHLKNLIYDD